MSRLSSLTNFSNPFFLFYETLGKYRLRADILFVPPVIRMSMYKHTHTSSIFLCHLLPSCLFRTVPSFSLPHLVSSSLSHPLRSTTNALSLSSYMREYEYLPDPSVYLWSSRSSTRKQVRTYVRVCINTYTHAVRVGISVEPTHIRTHINHERRLHLKS